MNYSLLVNTCDKFEDCWDPFFQLFSTYWSDYKGKIYLNTEYKDYSYPGLDIVSIQGCEKHHVPRNKRATWSQCLKWALDSIDTDVVLYMQEDYFLKGAVKDDWINYFSDFMNQHSEIPCIQLTNSGLRAEEKSKYDFLYIGECFLSCQASFWHKDVLLSLVRDHETAWNFEWWGSKRAKYLGYIFFTVDPTWLKSDIQGIIPYVTTGVIGGKWYKPVIDLFQQHNINVDFSKRGFYQPNRQRSLIDKIKIKKSIWRIKSILEIAKMKCKIKWL